MLLQERKSCMGQRLALNVHNAGNYPRSLASCDFKRTTFALFSEPVKKVDLWPYYSKKVNPDDSVQLEEYRKQVETKGNYSDLQQQISQPPYKRTTTTTTFTGSVIRCHVCQRAVAYSDIQSYFTHPIVYTRIS